MYATQPLLPVLRTTFATSEGAVGWTISAVTLGCAITAPVVGPFADRIGRKRLIVVAIALLALATFGAATATTLAALIVWRFVQGMLMPGIFAVTVAYIAEEFPADVGGRAVGFYIAGNVLGGFLGRYIASLVAEEHGWNGAFVVLGWINVAGAIIVFFALPRSRNFMRTTSLAQSFSALARYARDPAMLAAYATGASVLFTLVAAFTYAMYLLSEPPFSLGTLALGHIFFVYLIGVVATPLSGLLIDRRGHRFAALIALALGAFGMLVTLLHSVAGVVIGLGLLALGVFAGQVASQGYVQRLARGSRSTAVALYLTVYYTGGALGAIAPAPLWTHGGWPAVVALVAVVQLAIAAVVYFRWAPHESAAVR